MRNVIIEMCNMTVWLSLTSLASIGVKYHHVTSFPYISGDTFRESSNHVIDNDKSKINVRDIKKGDIIFVEANYLEYFFKKIVPHIETMYVLLTHNSDLATPGEYTNYLNDTKLLAWFGQNMSVYLHDKLFNIPIGIANKKWKHGNIAIVNRVQKKKTYKKHLLYMNFSPGTNKDIRTKVYNLFRYKPYCYYQEKKSFESYLIDLAESKFVLSPPGNGEDCHRTWEALYMGSIPIVQTSFLDPMFEGLPVLIIDDWSEINQSFLEQKYKEINTKEYNLDRLYMPYWFEKIKVIQNQVR